MVAKVKARWDAGRRNTLSMSAMRQIFCLRNAKFSCRMGCERHELRALVAVRVWV